MAILARIRSCQRSGPTPWSSSTGALGSIQARCVSKSSRIGPLELRQGLDELPAFGEQGHGLVPLAQLEPVLAHLSHLEELVRAQLGRPRRGGGLVEHSELARPFEGGQSVGQIDECAGLVGSASTIVSATAAASSGSMATIPSAASPLR